MKPTFMSLKRIDIILHYFAQAVFDTLDKFYLVLPNPVTVKFLLVLHTYYSLQTARYETLPTTTTRKGVFLVKPAAAPTFAAGNAR